MTCSVQVMAQVKRLLRSSRQQPGGGEGVSGNRRRDHPWLSPAAL